MSVQNTVRQSLRHGSFTIILGGQIQIATLRDGSFKACQYLQHVEGLLVGGSRAAACLESGGHLGQTQSAGVLGIIKGERDFLIALGGGMQDHGPAEAVGIGNTKSAFGAVNSMMGSLAPQISKEVRIEATAPDSNCKVP